MPKSASWGTGHSPIESRSVRVRVKTASQCIEFGHSTPERPDNVMIA
jgi:hypothetical protein